MKSKVILSGTLLVLLGSSVVWAGDPWKEKPYTEWTEEEVKKILEKSPWAKVLIRNLNPPIAEAEWGNRRTDHLKGTHTWYWYYLRANVQWASSRTVREAWWRHAQLVGRVTHVVEHRRTEDYIIIWVVPELQGDSPSSAHGHYFSDPLRPTETPDAYLEPRRSKQKVLPVSVNYIGNAFELIFPRYLDGKPIFGPNEKKVGFNCKVMLQRTSQGKLLQGPNFPQEFKLRVDFDLREMVRDGEPDL